MIIPLEKLKKIILYNFPKPKYDFLLSNETSCKQINSEPPNSISTYLNTNIKNLEYRYSSSINSDIIFREFKIMINNKSYDAIIICIDGMIDSNLVNDYLLKPLMITNRNHALKKINGIKIRKNFKIDLKKYIHDTLIPQNDVSEVTTLDELILRCKLRELCPPYRFH